MKKRTTALLFLILVITLNARASFIYTQPMGTERQGHTATLLQAGGVLIAGGDITTPSAELYDPITRKWTVTGGMVMRRRLHTATLLPNGKVLVAGGGTVSGVISIQEFTAELYDPSTGKWTAVGGMHAPRERHTATLLPDGKVFVAGGFIRAPLLSVATAQSEIYDPNTATWTVTRSMSSARYGHTATLLPNGKVLIAGGAGKRGSDLYDPNTGNWTATGQMSSARDGHTATLLPNGKVLVAGGGNNSSAETYDPNLGTWTVVGGMATARRYYAATLLPDGRVLVTGGGTDSRVTSSAELYDPITEKWTVTGPMGTFRWFHTSTLLAGGRVLIAGGYDGDDENAPLSSAELFNLEQPGDDPAFCLPRRAMATAQLVNGFVVGVSIADGGCGYTETPVILIQGGGGAGASATAVVSNGILVAVKITNAGVGYSSTPEVVIASPAFDPKLSIAISKIKVTQTVVLGRTYVLESSDDMVNWSAAGPSFITTSETVIAEFDVDAVGRFFRLRQLP